MNINEGIKRIALLIKGVGIAFALLTLAIVWEKQDIGTLLAPIAVYGIFHVIGWVVEGFAKD